MRAMNEHENANLLFQYLNEFRSVGYIYFNLDWKECTLIYETKFDLFREQLKQDIPDEKTARKLMNKLAKQILLQYTKEKQGKSVKW